MQEIIVYSAVGVAVFFLVKKSSSRRRRLDAIKIVIAKILQ